MAKIHIGSEYCKTFDSIAKLYKEGCVEEGVIIRIDGDKIVTPSHEFVLSRNRTIKNDAEKARCDQTTAERLGLARLGARSLKTTPQSG